MCKTEAKSIMSLILFFLMCFILLSIYPPVNASDSNDIIIDNKDSECTFNGQWQTSAATAGFYGTNYSSDGTATADPEKWAKWTPDIKIAGAYNIYMRWTASTNRPNAAPLEIKYGGSLDMSKTVNQTTDNGVWKLIGTYRLSKGTDNYVKIKCTGAGYTIADAVRFEYAPSDAPDGFITVHQTVPGNIFYGNEAKTFKINTDAESVKWECFDYWGKPVENGNLPVSEGVASLTVTPGKYGWFKLVLDAKSNNKVTASKETYFAVVSEFDLSKVKDSNFGVQTHTGRPPTQETVQDSQILFQIAKKLGVKYVRDSILWKYIEDTGVKGAYDFKDWQDGLMQRLKDNNLCIFQVFGIENKLYDGGKAPTSAEARTAFANYVKAVLDRYKDKDVIRYVEILNEPNLGEWFAPGMVTLQQRTDFVFNLTKEVYPLVKKAYPNIKISGVTSTNSMEPEQNWKLFTEGLFKLGILSYIDEYSFHNYDGNMGEVLGPELIKTQLAEIKAIIGKYNNNNLIPLNLTETGFSTRPLHSSVTPTEEDQARYITRRVVASLAGKTNKIFIHRLQTSDPKDDTSWDPQLGIIRHPSNSNGAYTPKRAFSAYAALTRQLTGYEFQSMDSTENTGINSYYFKNGNQELRVICAPQFTTDIKLKTTAKSLEITDIMGNTNIRTPDRAGYVYLTVDKDVTYVKGPITEISTCVNPNTLIFELHNAGDITPPGSYSIIPNSNMKSGKMVKLNANKTGDYIQFKLNVTKAGTYMVRYAANKSYTCGVARLYVDGKPIGDEENHCSLSSGGDNVEFDAGFVTFSTPGDKLFKFIVTGKKTGSSGYGLGLFYIKLEPSNPIADNKQGKKPGFVVRKGSKLFLEGKEYRAIGVNIPNLHQSYFGTWHHNAQIYGTNEKAKAAMGAAVEDASASGFKFIRFFADPGYPSDSDLIYMKDPARYWQLMDEVIALCEQHKLKLIPSLGMILSHFPAYYKETNQAILDPGSKTHQAAYKYIRDFVSRYKDSPTILLWELYNEGMLHADVDMKDLPSLPAGCFTDNKSRGNKVREDSLTWDMIIRLYREQADFIKKIDPNHLVTSGDGCVRDECTSRRETYPNFKYRNDTFPEWINNNLLSQPEPLDVYSYHCYPDNKEKWGMPSLVYMKKLIEATLTANKPVFIGELGQENPSFQDDPEAKATRAFIDMADETGVSLMALWVWHFNWAPDRNLRSATHQLLIKRCRQFNEKYAAQATE